MVSTLVGTPTIKALSYAVTNQLWNALGREPYDLATVAAGLGVSPRTLIRRLLSEGTTYQEILRSVRVDLGQTLLAEQSLSLSSVAQYLGYSEQSAWSRAFRRDVGVTPSTWRTRAGLAV
jgi:AraC-like DNA-binding protein